MEEKQPDALRLADWLEADACDLQPPMDAAAELRRLHAENRRLRENDDRYTWLVDWLVRAGLLTAQKCQITGSETYGDWWILRKPYAIDGNQLLGYGKTESDAIDSAIAKMEGRT